MNSLLRMAGIGVVCGVGIMAMLSGRALAGWKNEYPVLISPNTFARGAFGSVRKSSDSNQYIYCVMAGGSALTWQGACYARDNSSPPVTLGCSTTDSRILMTMQKIASDSLVEFTRDANGNCSRLIVYGTSYFPPVTP